MNYDGNLYVDHINNNTKAKVYKTQSSDEPVHSKRDSVLLSVGTKVRTLLNHPVEIGTNKRLFGDFRATDIRWSRNIRDITWVVLKPAQPPEYRVGHDNVLYTAQQLQVIKPSEHSGFV